MVRDLQMDIEIVRGALVRDSDGLALSSRNVRLSREGRRNSLAISRGLFAAQAAFTKGERSASKLEELVAASVRDVPGATIDYISAVNEETLERVEAVVGPSRILVVVKIDGVRLLDNIGLH
jgi:pantoate--beta-alanine ligase